MARKIGFIGVGNMAGAIIGGITSTEGGVSYADLVLYDCLPEKCEPYAALGAHIAINECDVALLSDVVVLAIKPQGFPALFETLAHVQNLDRKLIVTIAAGITVESISSALHTSSVVRVLPNTPMLIGQGVSVICRNNAVSADDFAFVVSMFEASGRVVLIDESEMNRIISVTSSSPAYVFAFIKAICDGAAAQGLTGEHILPAVCDVVIGSAMLLKQGSKTPEEQISVVTSKGGTTERAMAVLEEDDLYGMLEKAMKACTRRAEELSGN
ncbi:MAG: pyrroline-5-carboxylate reductase [Ruminococcaceae bacterium]|nr:pyrroline-5-carboxylate reductase [Oscillospiraceae bacterium]